MDSFRFDFRYVNTSYITLSRIHFYSPHTDVEFQTKPIPINRGNHETGGAFKQGRLMDDVKDLIAVVAYLKRTFGYTPDLLVGHSRGSVVAQYWIYKTEDGRKVSGMVNASGRFRMNVSRPFLYTTLEA